MNTAMKAWADQVNAHVAVTVEACYRFLDSWEEEVYEEEDENSAQEAVDAALALFDAMTLFDSLMKQQPA